MEDDNEASITGLTLGLGIGGGGYGLKQKKVMNNSTVLSLDLNLDDDHHHQGLSLKKRTSSSSSSDEEHNNHHKTNEKRNDEKNHSRKKLRLSKDQSAMLEDSFRLHTTLNQAQKQALAEKLNLKQRQVEVWFQNRRARTKLKQTEVDCEFLRKCCEKLTDENIRLKEEVKELRALKIEPSLFIQVSKAATLTLCSSCEEQMNNTHNEEEKDATVISDVVQNNNHNMESSIEN